MTEEEQAQVDVQRQRYRAAMHAMQSGVAMLMNYDGSETSPKHLRVGVNSALIDSAAVAQLLIEKGIITELELFTKLADLAEKDKASYEGLIKEKVGAPVTLG